MKKFTRKHVLLASLSLVAVSGEAWAVEEQPCHLVMNGLPSTCRIKCRLVETEGLSLWSPEGDLSSCLRVDDHINVPGTTDNWELSNANVMNALLPMLNLYSTYARSQWNSNTQPLTNAKSSTSEVDGPKCPMIGSQELKKIKLLPNGDVEHASEASSLLKGLNTDVANVTFKAKIPANEVKDCPAIRDALRKAVEKQCEAKPAAASAATGGQSTVSKAKSWFGRILGYTGLPKVFGALTGGFGSVSRIGDIASVVVSRLFGGKAADAVREAGVCKRYRQSLVQIQNWNNNDYEAADQDTEALAAAARDADDFLNRPDHLKMICQESCNSQRWQIALKSVFSFNPVATIKNFSVKVIPGSEISVDESTGAVNCNCGIAPRKR